MPRRRKKEGSSEIAVKQKRIAKEKNSNTSSLLNAMYGVDMPSDLHHFWKMCLQLNPSSPLDALSPMNLNLVGPFHFMDKPNQSHKQMKTVDYHMMWRYYYDTPEFLTVFASNCQNNFFHVGYFRDDPTLDSCVVVSNSGTDAVLEVLGDNLFAAIYAKLAKLMKNSSGNNLKSLKVLSEKVEEFAEKENFDLAADSSAVRERRKNVVANTFHKAGIVVPLVDGVGYRPLHHSDGKLKRLFKEIVDAKDDDERLKAFDPIQEIVTFIQFANDECDYGMGLELGIDLFCSGSRYFFKMSERLLTVAYELLDRKLYGQIAKAHFADRRRDNVSRRDLFM